MIQRKAFKYRLKATGTQQQQLCRFAGCSRFVWNRALSIQKECLERKEPIRSYVDLAQELVQWKKETDTSFLRDAHSQILQQTLKHLDQALRAAFDKTDHRRFPRFKKKGRHDSFRYPQGFAVLGNRIFLPKIGFVAYRKSREIEGEPKNVTVSRRGRHWYVAIQTEREIPDPVHPSSSLIAIDVGIESFATQSDGVMIKPIHSFRFLEKRLKREQRSLSRKVKFSHNWQRQKQRVSRIHERIANARQDFLHKNSTTLSKNHAWIVMEDLKVSHMSASARGTKEDPGKNVKAKSGLNKSILDQGWFEFRRQLEYKLLWQGGRLILINPQYTSQTCSRCGHISPENRKSQSAFVCSRCGFEAHADINAAVNIKAAGRAVLACGDITPVAG